MDECPEHALADLSELGCGYDRKVSSEVIAVPGGAEADQSGLLGSARYQWMRVLASITTAVSDCSLCVGVAMCILAVAVTSPAQESVPLEIIMSKASANIRVIDSMIMEWRQHDATATGTESTPTRLTQSGTMFRVDLPSGDIRAFDGTTNQRFLKSSQVLAVDRDPPVELNPYGTMHPLLWTYAWVLPRGMPLTLTNIKSVERWKGAFAEARYLSCESLEPHGKCDVVCVSRTDENTSVRIWFARSYGWYPVMWGRSRTDMEAFSFCVTASEVRKVVHDAGVSYIPMQVAISQVAGNGNVPLDRLFVVSEARLKLNTRIPDDLFHIPRGLARVVMDAQEERRFVEKREKPFLQAARGEPRHSGSRWLFSLASCVILAAIAAVVAYIRSGKGAWHNCGGW